MKDSQLVVAGIGLAKALAKVISDAEESSGDSNCCQDLRDALFQWELSYSYLLRILVKMCERGYSISIEEPWHMDPEEVYKLSEYKTAVACAQAAHTWHDQMDLVDFYFFKEDDSALSDWLIWVPSNDRGEQLCDYVADRAVDEIDRELGGEDNE